MAAFNGILNNNSVEHKVILYLDFSKETPYTTDFFMCGIRSYAKIDNDTCVLEGSEYKYKIQVYDDETLICGKEVRNVFHWCLPCFYKPKFFLLTSKETP